MGRPKKSEVIDLSTEQEIKKTIAKTTNKINAEVHFVSIEGRLLHVAVNDPASTNIDVVKDTLSKLLISAGLNNKCLLFVSGPGIDIKVI